MGRIANSYWVKAERDAEAGCWYVAESDVPGLAAGAGTVPELMERLRILVPEMLEANGHEARAEVPIELMTHYTETLRLRA